MSTRRNIPTRRTATRASSAMTTNNPGSVNDEIVNLVEVKEQAQDFFAKNRNLILGVVFGIVLLIGGYLLYKFLYQAPREKEAVSAMYQAEMQFKRDSFASALNNPGGGFEGFADIVENYGGTKAGNTAKLYAGLCQLNLGKFQEAIDYLDDYDANDDITPSVKYGAMADATAELGDIEKAYGYYEKAANAGSDEFTAPFYLNKLGLLQFSKNQNDKALSTFKKIFEEYPASQEAREAEKFIARLEQ
jgi:tetratricopeptide (TPR) repeat protein